MVLIGPPRGDANKLRLFAFEHCLVISVLPGGLRAFDGLLSPRFIRVGNGYQLDPWMISKEEVEFVSVVPVPGMTDNGCAIAFFPLRPCKGRQKNSRRGEK
jgi:hypothetical protein